MDSDGVCPEYYRQGDIVKFYNDDIDECEYRELTEAPSLTDEHPFWS